eukprot:13549995-Alexandrium_andersonii.AAC.1
MVALLSEGATTEPVPEYSVAAMHAGQNRDDCVGTDESEYGPNCGECEACRASHEERLEKRGQRTTIRQ